MVFHNGLVAIHGVKNRTGTFQYPHHNKLFLPLVDFDGKIGIEGPPQPITYQAGKATFIPAGMRIDVEAGSQEDVRFAALRIPDEIYRQTFGKPRPPDVREMLNVDDPLAAHLTRAVMLASRADDDKMLVDHLTHALVTRTGGWYADRPPPSDDRPLHDRIHRVVEYIEANLAEPMMIAELAGVAHLSPYHFARSFKNVVGVPPRRFIIERRVIRAQGLIRDGKMRSFADVAFASGFASQSHMNDAFRHVLGCTPGQYRRQISG